MKTKRFFQNSTRVIAAFLLAGASVVAIWSVATYNTDNSMYCAENTDDTTEQYIAVNNTFSNADKDQVQEINQDIHKLEKKRIDMIVALEKVKADRGSNSGMVPGIYYHPAQDMAEIVNLEKKIEKIDTKIAALEKKGKSIGNQQLALR